VLQGGAQYNQNKTCGIYITYVAEALLFTRFPIIKTQIVKITSKYSSILIRFKTVWQRAPNTQRFSMKGWRTPPWWSLVLLAIALIYRTFRVRH